MTDGSRRIVRRQEVERQTGLSRSSIYAYMKDDKFPKQLKLGRRAVGWRQSEIDAWLESRETADDA